MQCERMVEFTPLQTAQDTVARHPVIRCHDTVHDVVPNVPHPCDRQVCADRTGSLSFRSPCSVCPLPRFYGPLRTRFFCVSCSQKVRRGARAGREADCRRMWRRIPVRAYVCTPETTMAITYICCRIFLFFHVISSRGRRRCVRPSHIYPRRCGDAHSCAFACDRT